MDMKRFPTYMSMWPYRETLYCHGHPRPLLRGWIHAAGAFLVPILGYRYLTSAGLCLILTQTLCYTTSAIYHRVPMRESCERIVLKWDMCFISLYGLGSYSILYTVVLPRPASLSLLTMCMGFTASHWYHIWVRSDPSPRHIAYVGMSIVPFLPLLHTLLLRQELLYMYLSMLLQMAGSAVFVHKRPDPFPTVFGYHELFHLLVVSGGYVCMLCHWSISNRIT